MEDSQYLNKEDKDKLAALKKELSALKAEHKRFAASVNKLNPEERDMWRQNSTRTNEVYVEIKELRFKNILEAGK
jgi:hypothetical protein